MFAQLFLSISILLCYSLPTHFGEEPGELVIEEKGALFEGWVANLLRSYNAYTDCFDDWNYWATTDTKYEVDFLLRKKNSYVAIEVKSSNKITKNDLKGLKAIAELKGLKRKIIVYLGATKQKTDSGIEIFTISDFIKEMEIGIF